MTQEELLDYYEEPVVLADGLGSAMIGICVVGETICAVYSIPHILKILQERDGIAECDAYEFYAFNIEGAYVGKHTPIYVDPMEITDHP